LSPSAFQQKETKINSVLKNEKNEKMKKKEAL